MNVICATNNFGLGPAGTVSSIVNGASDINWFTCGDKFDFSIFKKNTFKKCCWSKDTNEIKKFVEENRIELAVVVLDGDLANLLLNIGLNVIFVDCIPFMWTNVEIEEGFLPLNATVYCAQKYSHIPEAAKEVLSQIRNLKWVNPIIPIKVEDEFVEFNNYVLINLGGMHSMRGNGKEYAENILVPLLNVLKNKEYKNIIITCGTEAQKNVKEIIKPFEENFNITVDTFSQNKFLNIVKKSSLFFTSPGSTTIFETGILNKETVLLPPQNLSQFFDIELLKGVIRKVKYLNWGTDKLTLEYLNDFLDKGELYVIELIYESIRELLNTNFKNDFEKQIYNVLEEDYIVHDIKANEYEISNGTKQIIDEIYKFAKGE